MWESTICNKPFGWYLFHSCWLRALMVAKYRIGSSASLHIKKNTLIPLSQTYIVQYIVMFRFRCSHMKQNTLWLRWIIYFTRIVHGVFFPLAGYNVNLSHTFNDNSNQLFMNIQMTKFASHSDIHFHLINLVMACASANKSWQSGQGNSAVSCFVVALLLMLNAIT